MKKSGNTKFELTKESLIRESKFIFLKFGDHPIVYSTLPILVASGSFLLSPSFSSLIVLVLSINLLAFAFLYKSFQGLHNTRLSKEKKCMPRTPPAAFAFALSYLSIWLILLAQLIKIMGFLPVLQQKLHVTYLILKNDPAEYCFVVACTLGFLSFFSARKWAFAVITLATGLIWFLVHAPIVKILNNLGSDSFMEFRSFDIGEALFWLQTIGSEFLMLNTNTKKLLFYIAIGALFFLIIQIGGAVKNANSKKNIKTRFAVLVSTALFASSLYFTFTGSLSLFMQNSRVFHQIDRNFSHSTIPVIKSDNRPVNLFVYIGESTTSMNMSLYGYPRDTSPNLEQIAKKSRSQFLVFQNVFSTHTHTSPSLLEALSVSTSKTDGYLPIEERKRISLVNLLRSNSEILYMSNQGQSGSYNQASSIIFRDTTKVHSIETTLFGNFEDRVDRPYDHVFFDTLESVRSSKKSDSKKSITFLHSYAGHGPYLKNIPPEFRDRVDNLLNKYSTKAITGDLESPTPFEAYDSAIRYIDFSLNETIKKLDSMDQPAILLYFSDHGESVFTGRGHDSSRFVHEMLRVPLIIYFNGAAVEAFPDRLKKYANLAERRRITTLAQIPSTIIDLLGFRLDDHSTKNINIPPVIGTDWTVDPILVRRTEKGISYVNLNKQSEAHGESKNLSLVSDRPTEILVNRSVGRSKETLICYHRSNSIAKMLRGGTVSNCLEMDVIAKADNTLSINHPPAEKTNLDLSFALKYTVETNLALWLDAKNITSKERCDSLLSELTKAAGLDNILVEFPPTSFLNSSALQNCASQMQKLGIATSYYVSTEGLIKCSNHIEIGNSHASENACINLENELMAALSTGMYTDFSFDFNGLAAMKASRAAQALTWNTWHFPLTEISSESTQQFRMIIVDNADPNNI